MIKINDMTVALKYNQDKSYLLNSKSKFEQFFASNTMVIAFLVYIFGLVFALSLKIWLYLIFDKREYISFLELCLEKLSLPLSW